MVGEVLLFFGAIGVAQAIRLKLSPYRIDLNLEPNEHYSHELLFQIKRTTIPFMYEATISSQNIEVYGVYWSLFATPKECASVFHDMGQKFNEIIDSKNKL